jgi:ABC-type Fe3+/spermidine/putrescine transport system ATPase subunit
VASVELDSITKAYGGQPAVCGLSLTVASGECLALLGPSGCGKTSTLNMIAGFVDPDAGRIRIGGKPMDGTPAYRRNTGMVFQSYALFPHLTVFENLAFGLRMRRVPRAELETRVRRALDLVHLTGLERRLPAELSGGQQQRAALARALVIEPAVLLLDEPLSNLDAKLRHEMSLEIVDIQKRLAITTIFVTHDQEEALAIADRVAVMNHGVVEQVDAPAEIYRRPRTEFVARFIGDANLLRGTIVDVAGQRARVDVGMPRPVVAGGADGRKAGDRVIAVVRAEKVRVSSSPEGADNTFPAVVRGVSFLGPVTRYQVAVGTTVLTASVADDTLLAGVGAGAAVHAAWRADDCSLLAD